MLPLRWVARPHARPAAASAGSAYSVAGDVPAALPPSIPPMQGRYWPAPALLDNSSHSGFAGERSLPTALWCRAKEQLRVMPNRPAPPASAPAPRAKKKAVTWSPYKEFCRAQRPLLPTSLRNAERERVLGQRWRAQSEAERANWGNLAPCTVSTSAPTAVLGDLQQPVTSRAYFSVQRPVHRVTSDPGRHVASSAQQTPLADRWAGLWKAKEAEAAAGPASGDTLTLSAPPPALPEPSGAPAAPTVPAAPTMPAAPAALAALAAPPVALLPRSWFLAQMFPAAPAAPATSDPAPAAPAAAAATKEEEPAAAKPRSPPEAPAPSPDTAHLIHRAWLDHDQRLQEELEQLTEEEAMEVLFGSTSTF